MLHTIALLFGASILSTILYGLYNLTLHPLRSYPGPLLWRAYRLPHTFHLLAGDLPFVMLKMHQRYGPIVRVAPDQLSYTSSAAIKTIYGAHTLAKDGFVEMDKDRNDYHKSGNGLWPILGAPTAVHRRYRKQFTHAFSDAGIRAMQPRIQAFVGMLIQGLKEVAEKDEYTDILSWYNWTTFDVIGDLAFGASFGCLENKAKHPWIQAIEVHFKSSAVISACKRYGLQFLVPVLMPKKLKAMRASNLRHNERQIEERIKLGTGRGDFWDNVIEKSDFEKGIGMSKPEMVANASVIVLAGSETTATLLAGTTYLLLKHPEIYKKLNEEVRTAFKSEDEINFMSVGRLEYMLAVLDEAMRVYTPVPNMGNRVVPACGATIEGKWVPGGTSVECSQWVTNYYEPNFHRPKDFIPERWLAQPPPEFANDDRAARAAFAIGPRDCIGRTLAYGEMRLILAKVCFNFDMELDEERCGNWIAGQKVYSLWSKIPLWVKLRARST